MNFFIMNIHDDERENFFFNFELFLADTNIFIFFVFLHRRRREYEKLFTLPDRVLK